MPEVKKEIPPVWTTGWTDTLNTGTWRSAIPVYQRSLSPCQINCPIGSEIPVWLQHVKNKDYHQAWLTLVVNNPLPAITGRVCHHPCEGDCNRNEYDSMVAINAMEQFVADLAIEKGWPLPRPASNKEGNIAIIGGGPAGLSCAYQLRMRGYEVNIFEAHEELGGVLRYGIPDYRLPGEILTKEIDRLVETGIKVRTSSPVKENNLNELKDNYTAICIAIGASKAKMLPQFDVSDSRILNGLDFLFDVNQYKNPSLGQQVVVIGGGSVAMDVARTARRLGKQVKVLALEDRLSLPAQEEEVKEALEEDIVILDGAMVQETSNYNNQLKLSCVKVNLDPTAPPGILRPDPVPETDFQLYCDTVIQAVGQEPHLEEFSNQLQVKDSLLEVNSKQLTNQSKIFACGDVATTERYVSNAIGTGKKAAESIEAFIENKVPNEEIEPLKQVSFADINTFYFSKVSRVEKKTVNPVLRVQDFREVKLPLTEEEVQIQSERCFSCGYCVKCDNCFYYCPDQAVIRTSSPQENYSINEQYCKGCGLCVEECPRGAVMLKEVKR